MTASPQLICMASPGANASGTNASRGLPRSLATMRRTVLWAPVKLFSSTKAFIDAPGCMVLLLVRFQAILVQALLDELEDVRCHDARRAAVACSESRIGVAFTMLGHRIARNAEPLGNLPLPQAIDQIHASNAFVVLHRVSLSVAKTMREKGLITADEYAEIDTVLLAKYQPYLGRLISENA